MVPPPKHTKAHYYYYYYCRGTWMGKCKDNIGYCFSCHPNMIIADGQFVPFYYYCKDCTIRRLIREAGPRLEKLPETVPCYNCDKELIVVDENILLNKKRHQSFVCPSCSLIEMFPYAFMADYEKRFDGFPEQKRKFREALKIKIEQHEIIKQADPRLINRVLGQPV